MKIAFVFQKDSHFKAVHATALRVCKQYKCKPTFIGIEVSYKPEAFKNIRFLHKECLGALREYDYVIACLGGYLLNHVVRELLPTDTKVISIFPGIVSHYQLDAFISRLNADQVWLNSRADYELYSNICKIYRRPNNGFLYGMSWFSPLESKDEYLIKNKQEAIFFEQTNIFTDSFTKDDFKKSLECLVLKNPKVYFKYKTRDNSEDEYFNELRGYFENFDNFEVITVINKQDILNANYYLSVSSSALVEGLLYGINSYLINNKVLDWDSKEFFKNSNMSLRNYFLSDANKFNTNWYRKRILLPKNTIDLFKVEKNLNHIKIKKRKLSFIKFNIIRLSLFKPKLIAILPNNSRLLAIQKSLEYLSK